MKSKKSALLMSFTSLLICFAMLVGSTFAWFTDTATTGVNKIVSGKLKVDLVAADGETSLTGEGDKLLWTQKVVGEGDGALEAVENEGLPLWEPGVNFLTQGFKIANKGNLALKWKVEVNKGTTVTNAGGYDLLDVIDFYVVTKNENGTQEVTELAAFEGKLEEGNTVSEATYYIKGVMDKNAGNEYQSLTLDGITVTVYATQDTVESDSFGNTYDEKAHYDGEISTAAELAEFIDTVLANKGEFHQDHIGGEYVENSRYYNATVKLACDIDMAGVEWEKDLQVNERSNIVIDGNGHSIKNLKTRGGLFGKVGISSLKSTVTVQNLTIDNATITEKDYGGGVVAAGAFAGSGGAVKYINCKVIDSTIKDAKYAGGFVGYDATGASTPLESINCVVEKTSVTAKNSASNGSASAGGFCGYTQSLQNHVGLNVKDDVSVTVDATRPYAGRYYGTVNSTVTLTNCAQQSMTEVTESGNLGLTGRIASGSFVKK